MYTANLVHRHHWKQEQSVSLKN